MKTRINKHISFLLCEHNCVIIPKFGGFVANYESASIDKRTNLIYAPKKIVAFNKSLQNNDGLLVNEIAKCEGLTFKQAEKELTQYVTNLKESLDLHKKFFIDKVGTLLNTSDEIILFIQSKSSNHLLDSFGLSTLQYSPIERKTAKELFEDKIKNIEKKHLPSNKKPWLKVAAILIPIIMISALGVGNIEKLQTTYANLSPFSYKKTKTIENVISPSLSSFDIKSPTNDIKGAVMSFYETKDNIISPVSIELDGHFVIAGAFSYKENAKKMIATLQGAGFSNSKIVNQNNSGLYRVCYDGFTDPSDAIVALRKIKRTNPSAWLLSLN